jgi:hypothetical protein
VLVARRVRLAHRVHLDLLEAQDQMDHLGVLAQLGLLEARDQMDQTVTPLTAFL